MTTETGSRARIPTSEQSPAADTPPSERLTPVLAIVTGTAGLVAGIGVGLRHFSIVGVNWTSALGLIALVIGMALVAVGVKCVATGHRAPRRIAESTLAILGVLVIVWTLAPAVMATRLPHIPSGVATPADFGMTAEEVSYLTADGVEISAWFVQSGSGRTVILRHGAGGTRDSVLPHAEVLVRHGYGVLLPDARGHGQSGGTGMDFGWFGDADIAGAVSFLQGRATGGPMAVALLGLSMGGEEAIGAADTDPRIRAVVSEGAAARTAEDKAWYATAYGLRGRLQIGLESIQYALADLLTPASLPASLAESARLAAPTPLLLITAGGMPDEANAARHIQVHSPDTVTIWTVPGATHTGALAAAPEQWEQTVISFLDLAFARAPGAGGGSPK